MRFLLESLQFFVKKSLKNLQNLKRLHIFASDLKTKIYHESIPASQHTILTILIIMWQIVGKLGCFASRIRYMATQSSIEL